MTKVLKIFHETLMRGTQGARLLFFSDTPKRLATIVHHGFGSDGSARGKFEPLLFSSSIAIADSEYRRLHQHDRPASKLSPRSSRIVVSWRAMLAFVQLGRCYKSPTPLPEFIANSSQLIGSLMERGFDTVMFSEASANATSVSDGTQAFYLTLRDPAGAVVPSFLLEYEVMSRSSSTGHQGRE